MTQTLRDPLSKRRLKAWLRLLNVTRQSENHLREFLRVNHATTLPRFDVMAALWRRREGLTMSELSRALLVSNGNATAVVDRLEREGLVLRTPVEKDRRTVQATLTEAGIRQFESMAAAHENEVNTLFHRLDAEDLDQLRAILQKAVAEPE
ncbi:MarR family transcriptional regulator [Pararhodobacter marinus]|uniref:MarR family transcriptional regulator n=1 Tax=Pararhodobacter marinus TaxID=2184063 RepID=A0A2U2CAN9_9RHOB|nr:MarR family transcriptional regulator [Pararhodobacter marinus]PWE28932.1 MarR family transcriptional regulator [Pararhodobacter marinus]